MSPLGRVLYAFSANICVPASLNQEIGAALGAQAGETALATTVRAGGFTRVRRGDANALQHDPGGTTVTIR